VKHAPGKPVRIKMDRVPRNKVKIVVADEGYGFDTALLDESKGGTRGFGLMSIRQRALSSGVDFQIDSAPGHGTRVTLLAPRRHAQPLPPKAMPAKQDQLNPRVA
jgi:signal transduction histidine kinase